MNHDSLGEGVLVPEISGGERGESAGDGAVFEGVSGAQGDDGNVPLPVVAVHGSFFQHVGSEILRGRFRRYHHLAIGLAHADIFDIEVFGGRGVSEDQLSEFFDACLALNEHHGLGFADFGSVVFKADAIQNPFQDRGLVGLIDSGLGRIWGLSKRALGNRADKQGDE